MEEKRSTTDLISHVQGSVVRTIQPTYVPFVFGRNAYFVKETNTKKVDKMSKCVLSDQRSSLANSGEEHEEYGDLSERTL